jgi:hypothetical protein
MPMCKYASVKMCQLPCAGQVVNIRKSSKVEMMKSMKNEESFRAKRVTQGLKVKG